MSGASFEPADLRRWMEESGALQRGHFDLSSGRHADAYVQCALLLQAPARAAVVGRWLAALASDLSPDSVLAPALGGLIVGHEVAAALGRPFRFTERHRSGMTLRRGFSLRPGERVLIVEDVVTTGRSTRETAAVATERGAVWVGAAAIVDRTPDAAALPVPLRALLRLELPSWEPAQCPLCRQGLAVVKPGSRNAAG